MSHTGKPSTPDPAAGRRAAVSRLATALAGVAGLVAVWWAAVLVFDVAGYLVATPPAVASAFSQWPGYLLDNTWVTLREVLAGFGLAVVTAIPIGTALAANRRIEQAVLPILLLFNAVPKPALAPPLLVAFGFGQTPKVIMVWLMCFFPITLGTATGLATTPAELVELARSLCASRPRTFVAIRLPAALPHLFIGVKTALPLAVIGAVVAELFGAMRGLGFVIQSAGTDGGLMWAAIVLLGVMSIALFGLAGAAERRLAPWVRHTTA